MTWWIWVVLGLVLMAAELFTAGFFVFFFGVGGVLVGALARFGLAGPEWMQWLLFSVISILSLILFRRPVMNRFRMNERKEVDTMIGESAIAEEHIAVQAEGKVELRGSTWKAINIGTAPIHKGHRCRVERVDSITLMVRAD
jgi:membrane protein implicated in regulation of membrane protease activity